MLIKELNATLTASQNHSSHEILTTRKICTLACKQYCMQQVAQLTQSDNAAGWVSYSQKWKIGTGKQYFTDIIGLSSTTVTQLASQAIEFGEQKRQIKSIMPFKVSINRKPVCDFLLVINSN